MIKDMFECLAREREIPDFDFFLNKRDFPILKGDGTIYTSGSGMGTPGIVSNQTDGVFKIGINNITPTVALDISGHGLITGDLQLNGTLKNSLKLFRTS